MSKVIMVPVHMDGFFLSQEQMVTEAFADFSQLPFSSNEKDYNPDTANISESILSPPFQNTNLNLKKGMHLHWSLPDALTKGGVEGTLNDYPAVPNRWLVTRKKDNTIEAQWVVESDYLTSNVTNPEGGIAYPLEVNSGQPFQYMGRQLNATSWVEDNSASRVSKLTAIGYGEPAFAAFYPNCHSVFGSFDPDIDDNSKLQGIRYQLIGWYSNTAQDPLANFLTGFLADNPGADQTALEQAVKERFAWNVPINTNDLPTGMVCYAELKFSPNTNINNPNKSSSVTISIGNTGTEALSAHIAQKLNPANAIQLEEQLENLLLQTKLQNTDLDLGPRFKEARHEKGFTAVKGGSLWEVKPTNGNNDAIPITIGLPPAMEIALNDLNSLQQQADRAKETHTHQRQILFADWYKYMLCAYPPDDSRDDYPDIDYVKWYIESQTIPKLQAAETDLTTKQASLATPKVLLQERIAKLNRSTVYTTALSKQLNEDNADTSGLVINNPVWMDNSPFSTKCLSMNGSDAGLSITNINAIKAISFWVNMDSQNPDNAVLMKSGSVLISKNTIASFRNHIRINGKEYFPSDTKPLKWEDFPKDQWCHLYIAFDTPLQNTDTIHLFNDNGNQFFKGKLMAIEVFTDKTLLFRPLTADTADTSGLSLTNTVWQDNKPFSAQCLSLNGTNAELSITGMAGVKALSLWLNIAAQNADNASLLATAGAGVLIGKNESVGFWEKICINGKIHPYHKALQWSDLPKDQWCHLYIEFTDTLTNSETLYLFGNNGTQFLNGKLAAVRLFNAALSTDELYYDQNMLGHEQYQLKETAAPRFWEPSEPVVLIEGNAVEPPIRHGQDGRLKQDDTLDCSDTTVTNYPLLKADFSGLLNTINLGTPASGVKKVGYDTWKEQPWHPFLLEWEVELFPMSEGGNLDVSTRNFNANFITSNYTLKENSPELEVQSGSGKSVISSSAIFGGRTVLTPYAKKQLAKTIIGHLNNLDQEECYQVIGNITDTQKSTYKTTLANWFITNPPPTLPDWYAPDEEYDTDIAAYELWYINKPVYKNGEKTFNNLSDPEKLQDFNYALIKAYQEATNAHFISQALSGFNNALLMQHQTLQLPVTDPLGFNDYRTFTNRVKGFIGDNTNVAPLPLNDFLPIRSGAMRLLNLRIIDSFGQVKTIDLTATDPIKAKPLTLPPPTAVTNTTSRDLWLSPRFVQPTRINFRWLSAGSNSQELNSHPESSPVCGWLLANHLDNSIAVYDGQGNALGIIDQEAKWRNTPGSHAGIDPSDFSNACLQKVISRLALIGDEGDNNNVKKTFIRDFISITDKALENIDPESFIHHQELALLMGRPIAVVRASLNLEPKGGAAIHYGWTEFYQDLERSERETNGFENVSIPIRVGERGQLNDGLLGYWKEGAGNALDTVFRTTVADLAGITSPDIQSYQAGSPDITQSLGSDPQTLTLLVDPRGDIHVTTGMLPAKSINIPKSDYTDALKKISISFLSAPVLSSANQIALPLPNELGYQWSWLAKDRHSWTETANTGILRKDTLMNTFPDAEALWTALLDKGWIVEKDNNRADIVPKDQRTVATLSAPFDAQVDAIQALLDAGHILPVNTKAVFSPEQTIKEGWLKLSPSDS